LVSRLASESLHFGQIVSHSDEDAYPISFSQSRLAVILKDSPHVSLESSRKLSVVYIHRFLVKQKHQGPGPVFVTNGHVIEDSHGSLSHVTSRCCSFG
jgi:hypothetical protein